MPPRTFLKCFAPKRASGESSFAPLDHPSIIECFEDSDALKKINTYFATCLVQASRPVDLNFLANTL
ncbi:hypothetical protein Goarm_011216 [Gossypium armourianum]|uniref:Uncharacterized protein n=1 Tax=Gossypium armourianum TaxID=34283 RepID=A0A7J9IYW3_9ROSI|nr:hypothetical protein [Gossypium armourianum]